MVFRGELFHETPGAECRHGLGSNCFCFSRGMPREETTARSALLRAYGVSAAALYDAFHQKHGARRVGRIDCTAGSKCTPGSIERGNRICPPPKAKCRSHD